MSSKIPDTRTRILEATIRLLQESAGKGARMGDIAKAAGISRQAVYLHFTSRTDLLIAATLYRGDQLEVEERLAASRAAKTGVERLRLYIEFWGDFIPQIYSVGKSLMSVQDSDEAAAAAWRDRMLAMRDGCRAAIDALHADGMLAKPWNRPKATDALWTLLLVPNWEHLTEDCGWTKKDYIRWMNTLAQRSFVKQSGE